MSGGRRFYQRHLLDPIEQPARRSGWLAPAFVIGAVLLGSVWLVWGAK